MDAKTVWMLIITFALFGQIILKLVNYILKKNGKKPVLQERKEETTGMNPGNPNDKPGKAQVCIDNGLALERLETKMEAVESNIKEIFRRLNK